MTGAGGFGLPPPADQSTTALRYVSTYAVLLWAAATLPSLWELPSSTFARFSRAACVTLAVVTALELPLVASAESSDTLAARVLMLVLEVDYTLFYVAEVELGKLFSAYWPCLTAAQMKLCQYVTGLLVTVTVVLQSIGTFSSTGWVFRSFYIFMTFLNISNYGFIVAMVRFALLWMPRQSLPLRRQFAIVFVASTALVLTSCVPMLIWLVFGKSLFDPYLIFRLYDCFQLVSLQTILLLRQTILTKPAPTATTLEANHRDSDLLIGAGNVGAADFGESLYSVLCSSESLSQRSASSLQPLITVADPFERRDL
ncbi:hypothetical protein HK105_207678 [Polyrhizophydium stewartii]|uniref:Transmembrane protein n=1 Tax=Polyrhizophydium stewartii TaxID=2732419 RepID=A0ABR4MZT9_9FUNG